MSRGRKLLRLITRLVVIVVVIVGLAVAATFVRVMTHPQTQDLALGDLDGDGDLDAFLANGEHEDFQPNAVLWNDGGGRFRDSGQRLGHGGSVAVMLQDMDVDGDLDALVSNGGWFDIFWNEGEGQFSEPEFGEYPRIDGMYIGLWRAQAADLNGDGHDDVFLAACCGGGRPPDHVVNPYNTVWLNDGERLVRTATQRFGQGSTVAAALADLDGDGDLDAFGANNFVLTDSFDSAHDPNRVWLNDGAGQFTDSGQQLGDRPSFAVDAGDVDGDGDNDAFVGNEGPDEVWWNDGQGNYTNSGQALGKGRTTVAHLADLDADGDLDAFSGQCNVSGGLTWLLLERACQGRLWLNDGAGNFGDYRVLIRYALYDAVALGDVNGDGAQDIVIARWDGARVWLNDGKGGLGIGD